MADRSKDSGQYSVPDGRRYFTRGQIGMSQLCCADVLCVSQVPAQNRLIDQGTVNDTMFLVAKGSLLVHRLACDQKPARLDGTSSAATTPKTPKNLSSMTQSLKV